MVGMTLLNFIKGNVDPTMPDKVQSIFSLDKPTIDTYAFLGFSNYKVAMMNTSRRKTMVRGTPVMMRSTLYHLRFWGVHTIKECKFLWNRVSWP